MTKRRKARELALQFLYETDGDISDLDYKMRSFYNCFASESLMRDGFVKSKESLSGEKDMEQIFGFFSDISRGSLSNLDRINDIIKVVSKNWTIDRMSRVDRNILRMSVYEILFHPEIPNNVIINEAIEIAKKFGNDESPSFINGILDAAIKVV
ncbi:transcription antitermination factor NusB [Candidatus Acidulodesulfobacterium sp. H_13]|uniref:transcription antitermination factor NusB n=1 Tax=Candidatus Acidulodesulfobacterium sp. H_13 TaxID=3395470 RepID=UPI003AF50A97